MAPWSTGDAVVDGVRLHYTRTGGDKPPVVLAHGFSDAGLCWTPVAQALEAEYDLIMVDARGHGHSDAPESGYTLTEMAGDLRGVIAELGLRQPAIMGHSMGGGITLALAGRYPEVAGAIIVEDAGTLEAADFPHRQAGKEHPIQAMLARIRHKSRDQLIAEQRAAMGWPEGELGPWADAKLQFNSRAAQFDPTAGVRWAELSPRIACPALLIAADLDRGAMMAPEHIATMQRHIPQLQVATIHGAGHNVRREQFERFMAVVRTFLATWATTYEPTGAA